MRTISLLLLLPSLSWAGPLSSDTIERAVSAEISRSTEALQLEGYPPPYYLSVRVNETRHAELRCARGGVRNESSSRQLLATPDVRVGSYELDNHPLAPSDRYVGREIPDIDDALAVRHGLWLKLDEEYKGAAADFLRKQALRVRRGKTEYDTDDFTREEPRSIEDPPALPAFDADGAAAAARCSAMSRDVEGKDVLGSFVEVQRETQRGWFLDSSGAKVRSAGSWARLEAGAQAMTGDGMRVNAYRSFMAPTAAGLPDPARLAKTAREMVADLAALKAASSTSPFNAPALIDPSVGAAVVQALASRLSGDEQRNPDGAQTFRDRLGKAVLPEAISLDDDPTLAEFQGEPLVGHYAVDDQGVPARKVTLVEKGVLKNFLLSRYPVIGFARSNGHGRAEPGRDPMGRAANLVLRVDHPLSEPQLLDRLREETAKRGKPYGIYIKKARSWTQQDKTGQQQAFRLLPTLVYVVDAKTGAQTLVRDLDMVGTPLDLLGRILAAGDDARVTSGFVDQPSGSLPVSAVCPTLLLGEVELQRAETKPERPMVLPAPR